MGGSLKSRASSTSCRAQEDGIKTRLRLVLPGAVTTWPRHAVHGVASCSRIHGRILFLSQLSPSQEEERALRVEKTQETAAESQTQTDPEHKSGGMFPRGRRLFFLGRLALGIILILASIDKALKPAAFAEMIFNYQLLPDQAVNLTAIVLPWLELILGILLIAGFWLQSAVALSTILLTVFFSALLISLARGLNIHCGCFSTGGEGEPEMLWDLFRDAIFLCIGFYLSYRTFFRRGPSSP